MDPDELPENDPYLTGTYGVSDFDEGSADIPIWGWLSGAQARRDAAANNLANNRNAGRWWDLQRSGPSADDLAVDYGLEGNTDEYGDLMGERSQLEGLGPNDVQLEALRRLQGFADGRMTAADMDMMRAQQAANAQQVGGMNRAALASMQARGMGGSGAALATQLSGGQALANANSQANAQQQAAIQQRALGALQSYGSMGMGMYDQEAARRSALDAFNQANTAWRRGRNERNTQWGNRTAESRSNARQQSYENRERATAGATNQYQQGLQGRRQDQARQDQANQAGAGAIGTLISELL